MVHFSFLLCDLFLSDVKLEKRDVFSLTVRGSGHPTQLNELFIFDANHPFRRHGNH